MTFGSGHPLAYPIGVTIGALVVCFAWAPFGDPDQVAALATVVLGIAGYSGYRIGVARGLFAFWPGGTAREVGVSRIRQQYRLVSRSWLEISGTGRPRWLPVYFDPALLTLTEGRAELTDRTLRLAGHRLYPSGRIRATEPPGRLVDNPSRPDPAAPVHTATRVRRRLLFDAQPTVAAPFAALLWIYIDGGDVVTFLAATTVAAAAALWLAAIRGSDPS
ncbi:hypothetical protein [Nocardia brasiliensis]|uniref:Uncharacterized protein n=1 Tax=Nocardia brasiliensis (strain ATCC 700358 / HUJEG-1) TaxID=1133849 RepID=K0EKS4_NOCB7|nr:hypothetical protein [Nocardia brasiliensis]AFT98081.1 hypothetical protein O3I_000595 [Nocardia brasiliensis ATCC 700358]OCF90773.1 hypothetical protein AW168_07875 [Nocardia brasiliensis]